LHPVWWSSSEEHWHTSDVTSEDVHVEEREGMAQEMQIRGGSGELGLHRDDLWVTGCKGILPGPCTLLTRMAFQNRISGAPGPVTRLPTHDPASFRHHLPRNSSSDLPRWNTPNEWDSAGGDRCDSIKHQGPEAVHSGGRCVYHEAGACVCDTKGSWKCKRTGLHKS